MSDIIHLLPESIANRIAAGEVIQRPASVVKELMENALDAGATVIGVTIKDAGRTLIQVKDNGTGMSETDARMAFEKHATSKISTADDLFALRTMGFRGEALAAIAAVAHVELRTRLRGTDFGTRLTIAGSAVEGSEVDACDEGSLFAVKDLFFNIPARRKFLKSNDAEFRNILHEFERIALVNPSIAFTLTHNDGEVLRLPPSLPPSPIRQRIVNIFGKTLNQKLLPLDVRTTLLNISGFTGRPDAAKKRGAQQFFFVNGRFMRHPYFHRAVVQAYEQLIPTGDMPDYFIYFDVPPDSIDVNVHPTKTEIKFENEQAVWQILLSAVREALAKSAALPPMEFNNLAPIHIPVYNPAAVAANKPHPTPPAIDVNPNYNPFAPDAPIAPVVSDASDALPAQETADVFPYKGKYIITALKSGLAIIDQHRAHVRVLFDQFLHNIQSRRGAAQTKLFPEMIELTPDEADALTALRDNLQYAGFELTPMGPRTFAINATPAGTEHLQPGDLLRNMLNHAMETGSNANACDEICRTLALSLAQAAALPYGQALSNEQTTALLAALFSSDSSAFTPDGKAILTLLSDSELEKRFR